jgi:hypothetical protein
MSRKVFTAGEVLAAADVNSFLMDQSVMSFAGTAARGSAIPTPVTGMTTYLEDSKDLQIYDGTSYASPFGSTLVARTTFSGASTVSLDNVFTSRYNNYEVYISFLGTAIIGVSMRLRASGSDLSTNTYWWNQTVLVNNSASNQHQNATNFWELNAARTHGGRTTTRVSVFAPARENVTKSMLLQGQDLSAGADIVSRVGAGYNQSGLVFDGFSIIPGSGTLTGEIEVYGMRN